MAKPYATFGGRGNALDTTHAGGPLVWTGRSQAHWARARRLRLAPCERRTRRSGLWRWIPQEWAHDAVATWWMGPARNGKAARPAPWSPPGQHPGGESRLLVVPAARERAERHLLHGLPQRAAPLEERSGTQLQRTVHLRVDLIHEKWVKRHATMQHVREGTNSLWQLQAIELNRAIVQGPLSWVGWPSSWVAFTPS